MKYIHLKGYYMISNLIFFNTNLSHGKPVPFSNLQDPPQTNASSFPFSSCPLSHFLSACCSLYINKKSRAAPGQHSRWGRRRSSVSLQGGSGPECWHRQALGRKRQSRKDTGELSGDPFGACLCLSSLCSLWCLAWRLRESF